MRQAWAAARVLLQAGQPEESRLPDYPGNSEVVAHHPDVIGAVPPLLPLPAPLPSLSAALSRRRAIFGAVEVDELDTAAEARNRHMQRQLHGALEWGFAFVDAFDLGPAALDVIDGAIARMDARDARDEDREPYLADYYNPLTDPTGEAEGVDENGDELDRGEHNTSDDEAWLGWPEDVRAEAHPLAVLSEIDAEHDPADLGAQMLPWRDGAAVMAEVAHV